MSAPPYIVVAELDDGPKVTEHASKADACRAGMALRRAGVVAFAYPAAEALKLGLDPRCPLT